MSSSMFNRRKSIVKQLDEDLSSTPVMKQANTKVTRHWYFHSNTSIAGPTHIQSLRFWDRTQRYLRTNVPRPPPKYIISPSWIVETPELASPSRKNIDDIHAFLGKYANIENLFTYEGDSTNWSGFLNDPNTIFLILRNPEGDICATAASTTERGVIGFSHPGFTAAHRFIDYLCIHPHLRNRGIMGWLLGWIDHYTHTRYNSSAHFVWTLQPKKSWPPPPIPPVVSLTLYKKRFEKRSSNKVRNIVQISSKSAMRVLEDILRNPNEEIQYDLGVSFELYWVPAVERVSWYRYDIPEHSHAAILVGLVKTKYNVVQVVYCSYVRIRPGNVEDLFGPFWDNEGSMGHCKTAIELAAKSQPCDWLLISDMVSHYGGGKNPSTWSGFTKEKVQAHLYLYNWMPPKFNLDSLLWLSPTF
jgi:hypothetical protein